MAKKDEDEIIDVVLEGDDDDDDDDAQDSSVNNEDTGTDAVDHGAPDDEAGASVSDSDLDNHSEEDREAIRERRRQERQDRKNRAKERTDTLRRELAARDSVINEMREKLEVIERRNAGGEIAQLAQAKDKAEQAYRYYKDQIRVGTESANGEAVAEATEKLMQVRSRMEQLNNIEKAYSQRKAQPQPLDPRVANNAKTWTQANAWYDPQGRDQDSRVVLMLDQTLAEEGWNPLTAEYWEELGSRVKKYLPHRANRDNITHTSKQKSVVAGSGRETAPSSGTTFRLSAERVKALKDAGKWDDPAERNKMIKQYRQYDRDNANGS